jgi:ribosome-binding ATPase YchF (GTP1/OBG family)
MSINIGIIGLPQSGKTTVFNALTSGKADTASHPTEGMTPHIGTARVPEPRLKILDEILHPKKLVPAEARYMDVGASVKALAQDKGIGGELLNQLSQVDTLISVVRAFADESIPHPQGSVDIRRDIATLSLELIFPDLAIMERRLERIENSLKGAKPPERPNLLREKEILMKFQAELEKDIPIRELTTDAAEAKIIANYQFLTAKPLLTVVNIGEEQLPQAASMEAEAAALGSGQKCGAITLCGKLEMELAQMEEDEASEFREEFGLKESGLERTIKASYELSGLITFFTTASSEVRPPEKSTQIWKRGSSAPKTSASMTW